MQSERCPPALPPRQPQLVRIHPPFVRTSSNKTHRTMNILNHFRDRELRLRTVADIKNRVTTTQQFRVFLRFDIRMTGSPPTADDVYHTKTVGIFRLNDIERQCGAKLAAVNHILKPCELRDHDRTRGRRRGLDDVGRFSRQRDGQCTKRKKQKRQTIHGTQVKSSFVPPRKRIRILFLWQVKQESVVSDQSRG